MSENLPSITVLIAARPEQAEIKAVTGSRVLDYPPDKVEVIVARGKQPSVQRNAALRAARNDLIYFLDDDSVPRPDNLRRAIGAFADPNVMNVAPQDGTKPDVRVPAKPHIPQDEHSTGNIGFGMDPRRNAPKGLNDRPCPITEQS